MFTIFVTPPSCFRRPSLISASFPLPIFIFKPLYCAIFVLGLFCFLAVVMPLVGLICGNLKFVFLRACWRSYCSDIVSSFFYRPLFFCSVSSFFSWGYSSWSLHFANIFICLLLFCTPNINLYEGKFIIVVHIFHSITPKWLLLVIIFLNIPIISHNIHKYDYCN